MDNRIAQELEITHYNDRIVIFDLVNTSRKSKLVNLEYPAMNYVETNEIWDPNKTLGVDNRIDQETAGNGNDVGRIVKQKNETTQKTKRMRKNHPGRSDAFRNLRKHRSNKKNKVSVLCKLNDKFTTVYLNKNDTIMNANCKIKESLGIIAPNMARVKEWQGQRISTRIDNAITDWSLPLHIEICKLDALFEDTEDTGSTSENDSDPDDRTMIVTSSDESSNDQSKSDSQDEDSDDQVNLDSQGEKNSSDSHVQENSNEVQHNKSKVDNRLFPAVINKMKAWWDKDNSTTKNKNYGRSKTYTNQKNEERTTNTTNR